MCNLVGDIIKDEVYRNPLYNEGLLYGTHPNRVVYKVNYQLCDIIVQLFVLNIF
jgi:hypothetical protein